MKLPPVGGLSLWSVTTVDGSAHEYSAVHRVKVVAGQQQGRAGQGGAGQGRAGRRASAAMMRAARCTRPTYDWRTA